MCVWGLHKQAASWKQLLFPQQTKRPQIPIAGGQAGPFPRGAAAGWQVPKDGWCEEEGVRGPGSGQGQGEVLGPFLACPTTCDPPTPPQAVCTDCRHRAPADLCPSPHVRGRAQSLVVDHFGSCRRRDGGGGG